jgi:ubiquinone/menaquinone biosynthesis C-methylase UbiE
MTNWNDYSNNYDFMASVTPAYRDLIQLFRKSTQQWAIADGATLLEIGAGTGNFTLEMAEEHPTATVIHSEPEQGMQRHAMEKAKQKGLSNIQFVPACADELAFPSETLDAAVMVHVLYAIPNPTEFLKKLYGWLRPKAIVFACDAGRLMDTDDWKQYLRRELIRERGGIKAMAIMWKARGIFRANKKISEMQQAGTYWTHTGDEFATAFRNAGFSVERQDTVYRGCSDLLIARKI